MKLKHLLFLALFSVSSLLIAQDEATMLLNWDDPSIPGSAFFDNAYNEVWGFVQDGKEYGVIGSTLGTHFVDVDNLLMLPDAFVEGDATGPVIIHRDYHDYNGYLYAVADEGGSSRLQIIDLSGLPASTEVVYSSNELIRTTHNIFIDTSQAILYALGGNDGTFFSIRLIDISDPVNPTLISSFPNANANIPYVHDAYIEDNLAFLNCGNQGFYVVDFTNRQSPEILGTMTDYPQNGYNHSGWLHPNGEIYYLADENHGRDLKVVSVADFSDIYVMNTFNAGSTDPNTIPHNLIIRDNYLYVSYYYDGVQVFDITDPENPERAYFYDTYPLAHDNSYEGSWGVYPLLPSGKFVVSDMQHGLFIFEALPEIVNGVEQTPKELARLSIFPNPVQDQIVVDLDVEVGQRIQPTLMNVQGQIVQSWGARGLQAGKNQFTLALDAQVAPGFYVLTLQLEDGQQQTRKITVQR